MPVYLASYIKLYEFMLFMSIRLITIQKTLLNPTPSLEGNFLNIIKPPVADNRYGTSIYSALLHIPFPDKNAAIKSSDIFIAPRIMTLDIIMLLRVNLDDISNSCMPYITERRLAESENVTINGMEADKHQTIWLPIYPAAINAPANISAESTHKNLDI